MALSSQGTGAELSFDLPQHRDAEDSKDTTEYQAFQRYMNQQLSAHAYVGLELLAFLSFPKRRVKIDAVRRKMCNAVA